MTGMTENQTESRISTRYVREECVRLSLCVNLFQKKRPPSRVQSNRKRKSTVTAPIPAGSGEVSTFIAMPDSNLLST